MVTGDGENITFVVRRGGIVGEEPREDEEGEDDEEDEEDEEDDDDDEEIDENWGNGVVKEYIA